MIIDFRKIPSQYEPIMISGKQVEQVNSFKYLGVVIDSKVTWTENVDNIVQKLKPRMYCLRKLQSFNVDTKLLQIFYSSIFKSVISFGISGWGGNAKKKEKDRIDSFKNRAGRIVGAEQELTETLILHRTKGKTNQILKDTSHPLRNEYDTRLISRSGRYRMPKIKTTRYKNSFIPRSICQLNLLHRR